MKKVLLSNDDGYLAPGLACLADRLKESCRVTVVAPDRDRSGASNSLTLRTPLRIHEVGEDFYFVDGTPTDCVHLAVTGFMVEEPDMVIAGINNGANLGDDVLYSGTVAAATEGRFLGLPAIAVSLAGFECQHFETAADFVVRLLDHMERQPLPPDTILNINVPDVETAAVKGVRATRLGHRHKSEPVIKSQDPNGHDIYWVGPAGIEQDSGEGTDFEAVRQGYISITPLQIDLTRHSRMSALAHWLEEL